MGEADWGRVVSQAMTRWGSSEETRRRRTWEVGHMTGGNAQEAPLRRVRPRHRRPRIRVMLLGVSGDGGGTVGAG